MDVVLGVAMTPTSARLVLVEGEGADGRIVDTDTVLVSDGEGTASDQVLSAIVGTRDGLADSGHRLVSTGVVWSDHSEAGALRDALASRGIDGVDFFSAMHAGGALAKAASSITGYEKSALLVVEPDTATLAVVDSADGSIVGLASEPLITGVTPGVLANLVNPLKGRENAPDGVYLLGLGTDVSGLTEPLGEAIDLPVSSPDNPELALARGAALASAHEPDFEASTALLGQAYSLASPTGSGFANADDSTMGAEFGAAETELRGFEGFDEFDGTVAERKPFFLVGAPLMLVFAICAVALAVSLTVSVKSTVDQGPASPNRAIANNPINNPLLPEVQQPAQGAPPQQAAPAKVPEARNPAPEPREAAPAPQQPAMAAPAPEQPAPAQPAPEQPAPEQPAPEQPAAEAPAVAPLPAVFPVPIPLFAPILAPRVGAPWWGSPRHAYTPPAQTPPAYTPPVQTPPVYTPPVQTPPVYTPPVQTPPVYTPPRNTYTPPAYTPPVQTQPELPREPELPNGPELPRIPGLPGGADRDGGSSGSHGGSSGSGGSRGGWDWGIPGGGSRDGGSSGSHGGSGGSRGGSNGGSGGSHGGWGSHGGSGGGSGPKLPWPFGGR